MQLSKNICLCLFMLRWMSLTDSPQPTRPTDIWLLPHTKGREGEFKVAKCQQAGDMIQDATLLGQTRFLQTLCQQL